MARQLLSDELQEVFFWLFSTYCICWRVTLVQRASSFPFLLEQPCTLMPQSLLSAPDHHSTVFEQRRAYNAVDAFSCLVSTPSGNGFVRLQRKWKALISSISHRGKPSPLHFHCSPLSRFFALTTTGKNSTSPAGVSPPELEVMFVQQCAYNLSLEFEPMNHMSCTTCTLTLCHCPTSLLDIQPLRLPPVPSEPCCAAFEVARPQGLRAPLRQFDVQNLQRFDSSVHLANIISFDCDSDPSRPEEIASVGYPRSWWPFMMLLQFMVLRKRKRSPILSLRERLARAWLPASSMQFSHPWRGAENAHWKRELVLPVAACKISLHDQPELRTFTCAHTTGDTHQVWRLHGPICCHQCEQHQQHQISGCAPVLPVLDLHEDHLNRFVLQVRDYDKLCQRTRTIRTSVSHLLEVSDPCSSSSVPCTLSCRSPWCFQVSLADSSPFVVFPRSFPPHRRPPFAVQAQRKLDGSI